MYVTITTEDGLGGVLSLEVSLELTVHDLKAILEIEAAANLSEMVLLHHMEPMSDGERSLGSYGVQDNDIIVLANNSSSSSIQSASSGNLGGSQSDPSGATRPPTQKPQASLPNINWGAIHVPGPQTSQASLPNINWGAIRVPGPQTSQASLPNIDWGDIRVPGPQTSQASLPNIDWGAIRVPGGQPGTQPAPQQHRADDPEEVRTHFLSHPRELELLRQRNPDLARALDSGNADVFRIALESHVKAVKDQERALREEEMQRIRILNANPLDPDIQRRIEEEIQKKNIEENMQTAIEYTPESFSAMIMLYVLVKVNGVPVKALVDSGAAGTIMSDTCAERCGVMRLVDRRFAGMAIGVGTQRIIGKIHLGTLQIGGDFLTSSFKVLEEQTEDMLLGLDMLQRHQCCIDLKKNVLRIGTTGNEVAFLNEAELKDKEEMRRMRASQKIMEGEDAEMAKAIATSEQSPTAGLAGPSHQSAVATSELEPAIQKIISAGFSHEDAVMELQRTHGDWQAAIVALSKRTGTS